MMKLICFLLSLSFSIFESSPVLPTEEEQAIALRRLQDAQLSTEWCPISPDLGRSGKIRYIEDCGSLHQYQEFLPRPSFKSIGIHPLVCCPRKRDDEELCFPSDPYCPTHVPQDYESVAVPLEEEYSTYDAADYDAVGGEDYENFDENYQYYDYDETVNDLLSDRRCANTSESCVPLSQCSMFSSSITEFPESFKSPCGYDLASSEMFVCCASNDLSSPDSSLVQPPRFPSGDGSARPCEDRHRLCGKWKELGGCSLEQEHILSIKAPSLPVSKVANKEMFSFMTAACPKTCETCGDLGCRDLHPQCLAWSHALLCHTQPSFMRFVCRESCGVCGFLSPYNFEVQKVGQLSYTDINSPDFDCGRDLPRCEREGFSCDVPEPSICIREGVVNATEDIDVNTNMDTDSINAFSLRNTEADNSVVVEDNEEVDVFFSSSDDSGGSCSTIPITDRWVLGAAHCYQQYLAEQFDNIQQIELQNPKNRSSEFVEVRKIFTHPGYFINSSYNDISLLELGRRLIYDFEKEGLTPDCIDQGLDLTNFPATVSGFGETRCFPDRRSNQFTKLREMNVTLLSNAECTQGIQDAGLSPRWSNVVDDALPGWREGIPESMVCARGELDPALGVFTGACDGDSGGPMKVFDSSGHLTLVGLVSGGLQCGEGRPGWNTRVAFHRQWLNCIMDRYILFKGNYEMTNEFCTKEWQET